MLFSNKERIKNLEGMSEQELDVLVIGGGITGAGIILDGTLRELKMGLVEMRDFSSGTSSRSTKLVHGGLRYLAQFDVKTVAEVGQERAVATQRQQLSGQGIRYRVRLLLLVRQPPYCHRQRYL